MAMSLRLQFWQAPPFAAALYVAAMALLAAAAVIAVDATIASHRDYAAATESMNVLLGRRAPASSDPAAKDMSGSPFLDGPTVTVAGASLLQRVSGAVIKAGGTVQSSQVDVSNQPARQGMISAMIYCELEMAALQGLLYDIEAKMPFLFVDQLDVQASQSGSAQASRLRIVLKVSGQWIAGK